MFTLEKIEAHKSENNRIVSQIGQMKLKEDTLHQPQTPSSIRISPNIFSFLLPPFSLFSPPPFFPLFLLLPSYSSLCILCDLSSVISFPSVFCLPEPRKLTCFSSHLDPFPPLIIPSAFSPHLTLIRVWTSFPSQFYASPLGALEVIETENLDSNRLIPSFFFGHHSPHSERWQIVTWTVFFFSVSALVLACHMQQHRPTFSLDTSPFC